MGDRRNESPLAPGPRWQGDPDGRAGREFRTIALMLRMYCSAHHDGVHSTLCADCAALETYARRRIERCVFGEEKPTCANCTVHCYKTQMRERVRMVMRWAGPRMLWRHPVLAVRHLIDGRRPAPVLPQRDSAPAAARFEEEAQPSR